MTPAVDDIEQGLAAALLVALNDPKTAACKVNCQESDWRFCEHEAAAIRQHPAVVAALEAMRAEERGNRIEQVRRKRVGAVVARDREATLRARVKRLEAVAKAAEQLVDGIEWRAGETALAIKLTGVTEEFRALRAALASEEAEPPRIDEAQR